MAELEFSDFIVAAIDESCLLDKTRLATAFKFFDKPEQTGSINATKIYKAFDDC